MSTTRTSMRGIPAVPADGRRAWGGGPRRASARSPLAGRMARLACAAVVACAAAPAAATAYLTVLAGHGGSVLVTHGDGSTRTVAANGWYAFPADVAPKLRARPDPGWTFDRWVPLVMGLPLACEGSAEAELCQPPADHFMPNIPRVIAIKATFEAVVEGSLTVFVRAGGSVAVAIGPSPGVTVAAGPGRTFSFTLPAESSVTLTAVPDAGWDFSAWTLPGALECLAGTESGVCKLRVADLAGASFAVADFRAAARGLELDKSSGGHLFIDVPGAGLDNPFSGAAAETATVTVAAPDAMRFWGLELPGYDVPVWDWSRDTLRCADLERLLSCALRVDADGPLSVSATFKPTERELRVASGLGGSVGVVLGSSSKTTVAAGSSDTFAASVEGGPGLEAVPSTGWRFVGWNLSDGLDCVVPEGGRPDLMPQEGRSGPLLCKLSAGAGAGGPLEAFADFDPVKRYLRVASGRGGSVRVTISSSSMVTVPNKPPPLEVFNANIVGAPKLEAMPDPGWRFDRWHLSGPGPQGQGLECRQQEERGQEASCSPYHAPHPGLAADATVTAAFVERPFSWTGPGAVLADGAALTAVPYAPGAFVEWSGAPCDGSTELECDASGPTSAPTAAFRPFVAGGIKSLAFGLGYHGADPDHFRVSFRRAPGDGFSPVPGFERLAPGASLFQLPVSVHLLPWSQGAYLTEACDAANACVQADGGERSLERVDSIAAIGYFKAPNASTHDYFGYAVALSADGATLAVGVPHEDGATAGAFAPGDDGYRAALWNNGARSSGAAYVYPRRSSGAAYVYRRSDSGAWTVEAFVKAPVAGPGDLFGLSLALSADGGALAVGASREDSTAAGAFAPGDAGWQAALDSDGAPDSGAVTVYRRSATGRWTVEAFVKAPKPGPGDWFGYPLALSADGATLAVGARYEDSMAAGVFAPSDLGYRAALDDNGAGDSAAAYVYRRSVAGRWALDAFVKAPKSGPGDWFGGALALSADGGALAVGALSDDSSATGAFAPSDPGYRAALDSDGAPHSGAAYVYRRSGAGRWAVEAFVKAPVAGGGDRFGTAVALSADGATLAVGADGEDSSATGAFAPDDPDWQAALADDGAWRSGAAYAYRRSDAGRWTLEAYIKTLVAGAEDEFGRALALSADGATLVVGADREDSAAAGAFAPGDTDRQAALDSDGADGSGAATVYHRSDGGAWTAGSFLKAPVPNTGDGFGWALALSADGGALAVSAPWENGAARPEPLSGHVDSTFMTWAGAVYLY